MRTVELDYELPQELIAQRPLERREESRLLVYRREAGDVRHRRFADLPDELSGELVVVNDTRVVPARLRLQRPGGGEAEVLLLERIEDGIWEALARPSRRLRAGQRLGEVELLDRLGEELLLDPLEPPVRLVQEPSQLRQRASDRYDLPAQALLHGRTEAVGQTGFQLLRGSCERLDLLARAVERGLETHRVGAPCPPVRDAPLRALQRLLVHGGKATVAVG